MAYITLPVTFNANQLVSNPVNLFYNNKFVTPRVIYTDNNVSDLNSNVIGKTSLSISQDNKTWATITYNGTNYTPAMNNNSAIPILPTWANVQYFRFTRSNANNYIYPCSTNIFAGYGDSVGITCSPTSNVVLFSKPTLYSLNVGDLIGWDNDVFNGIGTVVEKCVFSTRIKITPFADAPTFNNDLRAPLAITYLTSTCSLLCEY
jgi:hypothetical protein